MSAGACEPAPAGTLRRAWVRVEGARLARVAALVLMAAGMVTAVVLRFWNLNSIGYNSDEAVYAGQGAALANDPTLTPFFPVFRAHPLLFQTILSFGYRLGGGDLMGRSLSAAFGLGTIVLVFAIGRLLYGRRAGLLAALLIALMPYDVLVTAPGAAGRADDVLLHRQPLPGSPVRDDLAEGVAVRGRRRHGAHHPHEGDERSDGGFALRILRALTRDKDEDARPRPGRGGDGGRRARVSACTPLRRRRRPAQQVPGLAAPPPPEPRLALYPTNVPLAIGPLVIAAALAGLWLLRRQMSWRETLLLTWIFVPVVFFQLWPVKGFQYLLPAAPAVALLAGRTLALWRPRMRLLGRRIPTELVSATLAVAVAASVAVETWDRIQPAHGGVFLAGSGGIPGGREMGNWLRAHTPEGSEFLAVGPSMANLISFYGHRKAYGISVGTNPARRNPAYEPIGNPDLAIRRNDLQYIVWDVYSASRTAFFSNKLLSYVRKYSGRAIHTEYVQVPGSERP